MSSSRAWPEPPGGKDTRISYFPSRPPWASSIQEVRDAPSPDVRARRLPGLAGPLAREHRSHGALRLAVRHAHQPTVAVAEGDGQLVPGDPPSLRRPHHVAGVVFADGVVLGAELVASLHVAGVHRAVAVDLGRMVGEEVLGRVEARDDLAHGVDPALGAVAA